MLRYNERERICTGTRSGDHDEITIETPNKTPCSAATNRTPRIFGCLSGRRDKLITLSSRSFLAILALSFSSLCAGYDTAMRQNSLYSKVKPCSTKSATQYGTANFLTFLIKSNLYYKFKKAKNGPDLFSM